MPPNFDALLDVFHLEVVCAEPTDRADHSSCAYASKLPEQSQRKAGTMWAFDSVGSGWIPSSSLSASRLRRGKRRNSKCVGCPACRCRRWGGCHWGKVAVQLESKPAEAWRDAGAGGDAARRPFIFSASANTDFRRVWCSSPSWTPPEIRQPCMTFRPCCPVKMTRRYASIDATLV